ncbi:A/G-specific DNA-adenine glycosylase [Microbacteriaceae bacterium MWH-Ta3]|nr:A/G-specific DNA-adenine glycosylase [Microbacteriaceae bacterium MWH-Ta3]
MPTRTFIPARMTTTNNLNHRAAAHAIARWFRRAQRPLPWREPGTSAWGVLLSEVMAQQTPVARVAPEWQAWIQRWPTPTDLAEASQSEVLVAWGRLGYPRRALNLWRAAAAIRDEHGGEVPDTVEALESLPGVGSYTARAVLVFAYNQHHPVVDTNVRRVLARLVDGLAQPLPPRSTADMRAMDAFLPEHPESIDVNKGVMELGAIVCTARAPRCGDCPVSAHCAWLAAGSPDNAVHVKKPQAKFDGSDRQMRGAILAVLRAAQTGVSAVDADTADADSAGVSAVDADTADADSAGVQACLSVEQIRDRCGLPLGSPRALAQFDRALESLLDDALVSPGVQAGTFCL